ncbi:MAG: hypothetical protein K5905_21660 [Roseibium sp.]|uniref:hypothetical protein n=1 Tax=Roseibium sp. TaxID=1936156 RepID=UPI002607DA02|nr:hypothetical protein [Roseibium sp.]MCV0428071.1 hypothetical protein [Roseibium sp.]
MMKMFVRKLLLATGFTLLVSSAQAAECLEVGGVAIPNFFSEGKGKPVIISATLMGSVTNASGKILAQRVTETGLEMDMEHYFGRADGGAVYTKDLGILTEIPGKPGRYMIEITYDVQDGRGRGTLEDYSGSFSSYGLVDLRDPEDLQGLVRYSGELCK